MIKLIVIGLLAFGLVACGGVAEEPIGITAETPPAAECTPPSPGFELNTGVCSIAHEPATRQCDAEHTRVYRCTEAESQPAPDCLPSLDCDPLVWCCAQ